MAVWRVTCTEITPAGNINIVIQERRDARLPNESGDNRRAITTVNKYCRILAAIEPTVTMALDLSRKEAVMGFMGMVLG